MQPYIWGKYLWTSIHFISLGYPDAPSEQNKIDYKSFFENLYKVLPCSLCSMNYVDHLKQLPLTDEIMADKRSLFKWTVDIHNLVNDSLNKKKMTYAEAFQLYSIIHEKRNDEMSRCLSSLQNIPTNIKENNYYLLCIFVLIILFVLILVSFKIKFLKKLFGI